MITLNTSYPIQNNKYGYNYNQSFKGSMPRHSAFLKPFHKAMDKLTDGIAKYYTTPAFSNPVTKWLSGKDNVGRIVDHMQSLGSFVISGMYMTQTLRNKNMDEKRKQTLAINQGLTLVASTGIAYLFSNLFLDPWNKNVSMKYAKNFLKDEKLEEHLKLHQEKIKKIYMEKHPEDPELLKFKKPNLIHYVEKGLKNEVLGGKLKGLDVLKSLIIFGSVYRFIGPVVVTPVANWIADKFLHNDKEPKNLKASNEVKKEDIELKQHKDTFLLAKPVMAEFLGGQK